MGFGLSNIGIGAIAGSTGVGKIIGLGGEAGASGVNQDSQLGQIYRDQWSDYKTRFLPIKNQLYDMATGSADNIKAEQDAAKAATTGIDSAMGTLGRNRSRLGQTLTPDESTDETRRSSGLAMAAKVGAVNRARLHSQDRDMAILNGASLGAGL